MPKMDPASMLCPEKYAFQHQEGLPGHLKKKKDFLKASTSAARAFQRSCLLTHWDRWHDPGLPLFPFSVIPNMTLQGLLGHAVPQVLHWVCGVAMFRSRMAGDNLPGMESFDLLRNSHGDLRHCGEANSSQKPIHLLDQISNLACSHSFRPIKLDYRSF